jgi:hypothetical protein
MYRSSYRSSALIIGLALVGTAAFGQAPSLDATMQSLLAEVRLLRQDLQAVTVATQRVQIVLYRLQVQQSAVAGATQRYDEARAKLGNAESARNRIAAEVKRAEDFRSATQDPNVRKSLEERLREMKASVEMWIADEPPLRARENEALGQLRAEQSKLSDLQGLLDKLDKTLETFDRKP